MTKILREGRGVQIVKEPDGRVCLVITQREYRDQEGFWDDYRRLSESFPGIAYTEKRKDLIWNFFSLKCMRLQYARGGLLGLSFHLSVQTEIRDFMEDLMRKGEVQDYHVDILPDPRTSGEIGPCSPISLCYEIFPEVIRLKSGTPTEATSSSETVGCLNPSAASLEKKDDWNKKEVVEVPEIPDDIFEDQLLASMRHKADRLEIPTNPCLSVSVKSFERQNADPTSLNTENRYGTRKDKCPVTGEPRSSEAKNSKISDGNCPSCGDSGEWRNLALFCRNGHGKFAG